MKNYEEIVSENNFVYTIKFTDENGKVYWIPTDPGNSDYQAYLIWLEEQNG